MWTRSHSDGYYDEWAVKAYVIHRGRMKAVIDRLLRLSSHHINSSSSSIPGSGPLLDVKVIAGLRNPCIPAQCCPTLNDSIGLRTEFMEMPPCVESRFGFQPERFIPKLAPSYVLNVPLVSFNVSKMSNWSSDKIAMVNGQRKKMNDLITAQQPLPSFAKIGCSNLIDLI